MLQSWAPPGQQSPPAEGHFQFGGAAVEVREPAQVEHGAAGVVGGDGDAPERDGLVGEGPDVALELHAQAEGDGVRAAGGGAAHADRR